MYALLLKSLTTLTENAIGVLFILAWCAGIALANGGWATSAAVLFFPYAIYLSAVHWMQMAGLL